MLNISRRSALALAGLTGSIATTPAAPAVADATHPVVAAHARYRALVDAWLAMDERADVPAHRRVADAWREAEDQIFMTDAPDVAGVAVKLVVLEDMLDDVRPETDDPVLWAVRCVLEDLRDLGVMAQLPPVIEAWTAAQKPQMPNAA